MFLVNVVIVVAQLVQENVQEHECPSLRFREPAYDVIRHPVVSDAQPFKNILVSIKIRRGDLCPEVIPPGMKKNSPSFLAMVKLIQTIIAIAVTRQYDALQSFGVAMPVWNEVNESLHVALADHMTASRSW